MLIVVPPSESKRPPPDHGEPLALDSLSFPELTPLRSEIIDALIETSAREDAFQRLQVRPSMADDVARNTRLLELPTLPAFQVYTGPLHEGLALGSLDRASSDKAARQLVITSALWGALRPFDRIPPYRLDICSRLVGLDRLEPTWRTVLPDVLANAADAAGDHGVVVDLRSPAFQAAGRPRDLGHRTVALRVQQRTVGGRIGDVVAKRIRGQAARLLLESGTGPADLGEVAGILGELWPVELEPPSGTGKPWTMTLVAAD